MQIALLFPTYVRWHYSQALSDMLSVWKNFLAFIWRFFSIPFLLHTLFSPFERMGVSYGRGFEGIFGTLIINTIMRVIGAVARAFVIVMGLFVFLLCLIFGAVVFIFWLLVPAFLFWIFVWGIYKI